MTQRHLEAGEKAHGKMDASFKQPKGHPVDYAVPNFGQDRDIKLSLGNLAQAETDLKHKWVPPTKKEIKAGQHPTDYFVPNFGQDRDIATSLSHTAAAEARFGQWVPPTKKQQKAGEHPVDYFVPNFGVDEDIVNTQAHIAAQEGRLKTKWVPEQDENGVWSVPEAAAGSSYSYGLVQTDSDVKVDSDPVCSSAGCNYASEKGKKTHPMNYFVPNFGRDSDINVNWNSLDWAENSLRHRWVLPHGWDKKEKDNSYTVPNFGVDEDIVNTQKNIAAQEKRLKHPWKPVQDENGVWGVPEAAANDSYSYSLLQTDA